MLRSSAMRLTRQTSNADSLGMAGHVPCDVGVAGPELWKIDTG
jgi:hypothetical protein